ncbi:MAG TPA: RIP metalloprotease RseP [Usitatibacter sp.]|nr:RIP metalloprotease RseP [Usitatibacter sp.]
MGDLALTILAFLVTVGILVVIHEFGHYLMARAMDVKILRFSVGFGRTLALRRTGRDGTEWVLAAIPLGGYVKMADEREAPVSAADRPRAFNNKSVGARIAIVLAGPAANFLLAIALYWVLFASGMPGDKPVLAEPAVNTPAAIAGFHGGDVIVSVGGDSVATWNDVRWLLLKDAVKRATTELEVQTGGGAHSTHRLDMSGLSKDDLDQDLLGKLGIRPFRPAIVPRLGRILVDSPAEHGGLLAGDLVVTAGGKAVSTWDEFTSVVNASPDRTLDIEVDRGGRRVALRATPGHRKNGTGQLGVEISPEELRIAYEPYATTVRYGPVEAMGKAVAKVWDLSVFSVKMLWSMIVGELSWKNVSGPITIADYAGQSAKLGWITSVAFLALVSVSLGVLNLLPIPLLDGGHLVYYFAEIVRGKPVSERTMEIGQRFGLALLLGLTFFAFYNDINRLFTG